MHLLKLLLLLPLGLLAALPASAQTLKARAIVASEIVTLGDLVAQAGPLAATPVFRAPDLGETGSVPARQILDAARAHGLTVDAQGLDTVAVTRASRDIATDELLAPLAVVLASRIGVSDPQALSATLDPGFEALHLPVEATGPVVVAGLDWQAERGTFDATVTVSRTDGRIERRALRGQAAETVPAVAARHPVERGAILAADDVDLIRTPKAQARDGVLSDLKAAVGQEVRHALREGQVLRGADLAEPEIVKRGQMVTIVHQMGALTLTASGQALRDATRGEAVQVMNVQSKRVLQAVATGPNQVTVVFNPPRALASTAP